MPMRTLLRFCIRATRCLADFVHARAGIGSATLFAFVGRKTSFDATSTKFGCLSRMWSSPALMSFISFRSSTVPFSQVAIMSRCSPNIRGTLVTRSIGTRFFTGSVRTSMNVRKQLFLQKLQRVDSLRVVRYSILRTASRPTNVVCWPLRHNRSDSCAAPMAPDSPQCS